MLRGYAGIWTNRRKAQTRAISSAGIRKYIDPACLMEMTPPPKRILWSMGSLHGESLTCQNRLISLLWRAPAIRLLETELKVNLRTIHSVG